MEKECTKHGLVLFVKAGVGKNQRFRCSKCNVERVTERRRKAKKLLIEKFGGKCKICGYDKYPGALEFHHLNPTEQEFGIGSRGLTKSLERLSAEAEKCILVCSNCHSEIHAGLHDISSLTQ